MSTRRQQLYQTIANLAAPPDRQLSYLATLGGPDFMDELALEFDDIALAAKSMLVAGELSQSEFECITSLDGLLSKMSDKSDLWNRDALIASAEWQEVRTAASRCLKLLESQRGS